MWSFSERSWGLYPEMFAPMVPKLILDIFGVPCTPGGCALFWERTFFRKKLGPQKIIWDKCGHNPL